MHLTRRSFLGAATAASLVSTRLFAVPADAPLDGPARLKLGVLSDIHLNRPGDEDTFLKALAYFRDNGADGVIIAGDIADTGRVAQLQRCAEAWRQIFPGDKAPDGRPVARLFVLGNHCVEGWTWNANAEKRADPAYRAECIGPDIPKAWDACFHEPYAGVWMKDVKGFKVVGAHWGSFGEVAAFCEAHAAELAGDKPFFFVMHPHPKNTCCGPWAWGATGQLNAVFEKFPNCVVCSGHSHYSLTDERTVWQGAFTSVNTSSLRYTSFDYNLRDNAPGNSGGYRGANGSRVTPRFPTDDGRQGMLFTVTDWSLRIRRREFVYDQSLGDDWVMPHVATVDGPMNFKARAAKRGTPHFAPDAKVTLAAVETAKKKPCVRVAFPSAVVDPACRAFEYEVLPVLVADDVELPLRAKRVLARDFHLPVAQAGRATDCWFARDELPKGAHVRFEVRPLECFGHKGAPLVSDLFAL